MNTMKKIVTILFLALVVFSCKKEAPVGPNLIDLYGIFNIDETLSSNVDSVDFTKKSVQFNGSWTLITPWTLTIKGRESGAIKTISGKSKTLKSTQGIWDGTSDVIFFKNETCDVTLSFNEHPDSVRTSTIKITGTHDYTKDGIVLVDFENTVAFNKSGNTTFADKVTGDTIPQGKYYFKMLGKEPGNSYWLGGLVGITAQTIYKMSFFDFKTADTATTFINMFYYGFNYANTTISFNFDYDPNKDGKVDSSYGYNVPAVKLGWHKVSFPLSAFNCKGYFHSEVENLTTLYISLTTNGAVSNNIGCGIDYVIITKGKPL